MRALPLESKYPHHAEHAYVSLATAVALVTPQRSGPFSPCALRTLRAYVDCTAAVVIWLTCGVNSSLSDIRTPSMLSSNTRLTSGRAGGMTGSVMGRRGRRAIISQLLETLRERLFAIAQAEMLFKMLFKCCCWRNPSNRRLNEHGIYIRHCQESNSQPVLSQVRADPTRSQWLSVPDHSLCNYFFV